MILPQLRRVRWAVRATLVLGVAASVVANILHALDNPISQAIAAWPPLALLLTVELISRVPVHRRSLALARLVATATIAGIAAWVSYWHMAGVAARYGETGASPYLLPLSVDGLIVVASICLVELGGRISALQREAAGQTTSPATGTSSAPVPGSTAGTGIPALIPLPAVTKPSPAASAAPSASLSEAAPATAAVPATAAASTPAATATAAPAASAVPASSPASVSRRTTAEALAEVAAALPRNGLPKTRGPEVSSFAPTVTRRPRTVAASSGPARPATTATARPVGSGPARPATSAAARPAGAGRGTAKPAAKPSTKSTPKVRRTPAETIAAAEKIKAARPDLTDAELAAELGISVSRWRTIRREAGAGTDLRLAA
ncbi:DUF2637 domain-containing protein [Actinoplanes sp. NPDC049548]|uniref:DUF2637 domain-containing protein n=1 Tax=Actinoplanes sp. NPDC049548 TaxID=3155152 RepID=UPI0034237450